MRREHHAFHERIRRTTSSDLRWFVKSDSKEHNKEEEKNEKKQTPRRISPEAADITECLRAILRNLLPYRHSPELERQLQRTGHYKTEVDGTRVTGNVKYMNKNVMNKIIIIIIINNQEMYIACCCHGVIGFNHGEREGEGKGER